MKIKLFSFFAISSLVLSVLVSTLTAQADQVVGEVWAVTLWFLTWIAVTFLPKVKKRSI